MEHDDALEDLDADVELTAADFARELLERGRLNSRKVRFSRGPTDRPVFGTGWA